jgi:hypothetical protein
MQFGAAGNQLQQQVVQPGDDPVMFLAERPTPVGEYAQHGELLVIDHRPQPGHPSADQCDRVRVGRVGLAPLPGGEHPRSRG